MGTDRGEGGHNIPEQIPKHKAGGNNILGTPNGLIFGLRGPNVPQSVRPGAFC
jgi:hypothetical protein